MTPAAILPLLSLVKWPATLAGAVLVFGLSTEGTLSLVSSNAHKLTSPVAGRTTINVPPPKQLASLSPFIVQVAPEAPAAADAMNAEPVVAVALRSPTQPAMAPDEPVAVASANLPSARIGSSAVNVRSGPSKQSGKIDVLQAGAAVQVAGERGGWLHVVYDGGDGWVYSTYLDRR